jgi:hypothetical protein
MSQSLHKIRSSRFLSWVLFYVDLYEQILLMIMIPVFYTNRTDGFLEMPTTWHHFPLVFLPLVLLFNVFSSFMECFLSLCNRHITKLPTEYTTTYLVQMYLPYAQYRNTPRSNDTPNAKVNILLSTSHINLPLTTRHFADVCGEPSYIRQAIQQGGTNDICQI